MISFEDVLEINELVCSASNEVSILLNRDNVLSALSVQQWYLEPCLCASALIRSITIGHGFQDGNKRTAACVGMMLLDFECSEDTIIDCILSIAKGSLKDVNEIASMLYPDSFNGLGGTTTL